MQTWQTNRSETRSVFLTMYSRPFTCLDFLKKKKKNMEKWFIFFYDTDAETSRVTCISLFFFGIPPKNGEAKINTTQSWQHWFISITVLIVKKFSVQLHLLPTVMKWWNAVDRPFVRLSVSKTTHEPETLKTLIKQ